MPRKYPAQTRLQVIERWLGELRDLGASYRSRSGKVANARLADRKDANERTPTSPSGGFIRPDRATISCRNRSNCADARIE